METAWLLEDADRAPLPAAVRIAAALHLPPSRWPPGVVVVTTGAGDFSDGHTSTVGVGPVTSQPPDMT